MSLKKLFLNIALSGKTFENEETGLNNLFIRYSLMNLALAAGFIILVFFALESLLLRSYLDAVLNGS
ncbi:MAG: hypothetical protein LBL28_04385, partial [Treponema sp.]|nr:hypothetical protein [Treponema sp.]